MALRLVASKNYKMGVNYYKMGVDITLTKM